MKKNLLLCLSLTLVILSGCSAKYSANDFIAPDAAKLLESQYIYVQYTDPNALGYKNHSDPIDAGALKIATFYTKDEMVAVTSACYDSDDSAGKAYSIRLNSTTDLIGNPDQNFSKDGMMVASFNPSVGYALVFLKYRNCYMQISSEVPKNEMMPYLANQESDINNANSNSKKALAEISKLSELQLKYFN